MAFVEKEDRHATFRVGQRVAEWVILKKLGEGGFGAVFLVENKAKGTFALKVERATEIVRVLKMEVYVLKDLAKHKAKHCCEYIDSGRFADFNYIVMTLVGQSLHDLQKENKPAPKFSLDTAVTVGIQCVEAIEALHFAGYIHRDIKPANFAVSINDRRNVVLLDFGMARKFVDVYGQVRRPRWAVGFRGTVRYAALSCHVSRDMSRKDDLETWMYMQIEMTTGSLPWNSTDERDVVGRWKEKAREDGTLYKDCPSQYKIMLHYIDNIRYYEDPMYEIFIDELQRIRSINHLPNGPLDWEVVSKLDEVKKKKNNNTK